MAHRPDPSVFDKPLTSEEIAALYHRLSGIDRFRVQRFYHQAYERCRLHGDLLPRAAAIQELVTAWKVLRAQRRKRPDRRD